MPSNTTGSNITAVGLGSLAVNTTGSYNIAIGFYAGSNVTMGSDNVAIANAAQGGGTGTIRIGTRGVLRRTFIAGISGVPVMGATVVVNPNGKLGVATSSARFKKAIQPMDATSEGIFSLKPVTFQYRSDIDPDGIPQFGLIAEEVEKINPALVGRDEDGRVNSVRYEAVNAMQFLKEHRKVEEQQKQIEALTAAVQQVSDKLDNSRPERVPGD